MVSWARPPLLDLPRVIDEEIRTFDPTRGSWISVRRIDIARQLKRLDCDDGLPILYEDSSVYSFRQLRQSDEVLRQDDLYAEAFQRNR